MRLPQRKFDDFAHGTHHDPYRNYVQPTQSSRRWIIFLSLDSNYKFEASSCRCITHIFGNARYADAIHRISSMALMPLYGILGSAASS